MWNKWRVCEERGKARVRGGEEGREGGRRVGRRQGKGKREGWWRRGGRERGVWRSRRQRKRGLVEEGGDGTERRSREEEECRVVKVSVVGAWESGRGGRTEEDEVGRDVGRCRGGEEGGR